MNVQLAGLPMLPWAAPPLSYGTQAQHIMSTPVVVLKEVEQVSTVIRVNNFFNWTFASCCDYLKICK